MALSRKLKVKAFATLFALVFAFSYAWSFTPFAWWVQFAGKALAVSYVGFSMGRILAKNDGGA